MRTLERTGGPHRVLQVDSVNVLQRAHFHAPLLPDGPLRRRPAAAGLRAPPRRVVEYWAHVQALMPVGLWPLMRHRMDHYRSERGKWGFTADPTLEPRVLDAVASAVR